jgi:hypothetical protein
MQRITVEAAVHGEEIFIVTDVNDTCAVIQLLPISEDRPHPRFGSGKGQIIMSEDFDNPILGIEVYQP